MICFVRADLVLTLLQQLGRVDLEESTSITFSFHSSSPNREIADVKVIIGSSTSEDILCEFGAPLRTFWKEDVGT
jgi:hypothetical protein